MTAVAADAHATSQQVGTWIELGAAGRPVWLPGHATLTPLVRLDGGVPVVSDGEGEKADTAGVPLPFIGEPVRLPRLGTGLGPVEGLWVGVREGARLARGATVARVLTEDTVVEHEVGPDCAETVLALHASRAVIGSTDGAQVAGARAVAALLARLDEADQSRQEAAADHERWRADLAEAAHQEADEREWCSEFDDFLEQVGLPRRSRDWRVNLTLTVSVHLNATSESAAEESVTSEMVREAVESEGRFLNWSVDGVDPD